jgi:hypothetical protein
MVLEYNINFNVEMKCNVNIQMEIEVGWGKQEVSLGFVKCSL